MIEGTRPRIVPRLDIDQLPTCQRVHLLVDVVHDGLGRPTRIPVIVMRGARPGPVFGLTAAVHGDELNGIPVIHRLFNRIDPAHLRGTLVGAVAVNLPGFLRGRREMYPGADLNHLMPGAAAGNSAEVYAYRVIDRIVSSFDHLLDLHTASTGRINSLYVRADMEDDGAAHMARLLRPQIILHNAPSDGTLRGAADELGIPAITVEIGDPGRFQPEHIRNTLTGVRTILGDLGMVPRRKIAERPDPVLCRTSRWLYTDHGGLLRVLPPLAATIEAGEAVATLSDIFGGPVAEYRAPADGVVIGKSVDPVAATGARILHFGEIAAPGSFHREA